jgi:hypothetical protein
MGIVSAGRDGRWEGERQKRGSRQIFKSTNVRAGVELHRGRLVDSSFGFPADVP